MTPKTLPTAGNFVVIPQTEQYPQQLFCDGVMGLTLTAANCKLDLFQIVGADAAGEKRKLVQTLVIPTAALLELCRTVIGNIEQNAGLLKTALADQEKKIFGVAADRNVDKP